MCACLSEVTQRRSGVRHWSCRPAGLHNTHAHGHARRHGGSREEKALNVGFLKLIFLLWITLRFYVYQSSLILIQHSSQTELLPESWQVSELSCLSEPMFPRIPPFSDLLMISRTGESCKLSIDALSARGIFGLVEMKDMNV